MSAAEKEVRVVPYSKFGKGLLLFWLTIEASPLATTHDQFRSRPSNYQRDS